MFNTHKYLLITLLSLWGLTLYSQNETTKWFFGNGAGLNFSAGPNPTVIAGGAITSSLGCASIADASGNLLFYTDGSTIYNQNHLVMANGSGLFGGNVSQPAMILKKPASANLYYVFTLQTTGFYYSIVDMTMAAGMGSVTVKNASIAIGSFAGKMTATKHCNGTDYWIATIQGAALASYSLTSTGLNTIPLISVAVGLTTPATLNPGNTGTLKLSPNGRRLALTNAAITSYSPYSGNFSFYVYDYSNLTGSVTSLLFTQSYNPALGFQSLFPYGCEFSPNGTRLYVAPAFGAVQQYDLCSPTASLTATGLISSETSTNEAAQKRTFQLGPNGKIYICSAPSGTWANYVPTNSLSVINTPNALGTAANYVPFSQPLGTYTAQWGLPNFPGSYFEQKPNAFFTHSTTGAGGCLTASFSPSQVCSGSGYSVTGYQWNFGDPASGASNTSFLSNPAHTYSATGVYTVQLVRSFQCSTDTIRQTISVTNPVLSLTTASMACGTNTAQVTVSGGTGSYSYTWSPGSFTTSAISISVTGGVYTVYVNDNGGGCSISNTLSIPNVILTAALATTNTACFGLSNGQALVSVGGGSGVYTYTWNGTSSGSPSMNGLAAGTHTLQLLDQFNLCALTQTFSIGSPPALQASVATVPAICTGSTATLIAMASGGTPLYQYTWTGGPTSVVYTVSQQTAGTYVYTVSCTDTNNCPPVSATASVQVNATPTLAVAGASLCAGGSTILTASGANSYLWQPGNFAGAAYTVSPPAPTIYTVQGDTQGCLSSATVATGILSLPTVALTSNGPVCIGQALQLNAAGNGNSYYWLGPNGYSSSQSSPSIAAMGQLNAGTYSLTVTAANSCTSAASILVNVLLNPTISITTSNPLLCIGQVAVLTASGASTYTWNTLNNTHTLSVAPVNTATYTVTGALQPSGCSSTQSITVKVTECLGITEEQSETILISLVPNPASDEVAVEVNLNCELIVVNALGVKLDSFAVSKGKNHIQLGHLSAGHYHLLFIGNKFSVSKKLAIVR